MKNLTNQVVLITGCSSGGIGEALAIAFAEAGHRVVASSRNLDSMKGQLEQRNIMLVRLDVTDTASIEAAIRLVIGAHGRIDILVNNAGFLLSGPALELPQTLIRAQFEVNVFGALALCQAAFPFMARQRSGRFVNLGSPSGLLVTPFGGVYGASKAALHALTEAIRLEAAPFGLDAILVLPGAIKSNIAANAVGEGGLSPDSLYSSMTAGIRRRTEMTQQDPTPSDFFARSVVSLVTKRHAPALIRVGKGALIFPMLRHIVPTALLDALRLRRFGLSRDVPRGVD